MQFGRADVEPVPNVRLRGRAYQGHSGEPARYSRGANS